MRGWCKTVPKGLLTSLLGGGAELSVDAGFACQYSAPSATDTATLILEVRAYSSVRATPMFDVDSLSEAQMSLARRELSAGRVPVDGVGDIAFGGTEGDGYLLAPGITVAAGCTTLLAADGGAIFQLWLCGTRTSPTPDRFMSLRPLLRSLLRNP
jgi:hypothetical protein